MSSLDDMTYNQLRAKRREYLEDQKNAGDDYSWWGSQSQIDKIDEAEQALFKETMKHLYARYGANKIVGYINKLHEAEIKAKELQKAEADL